MVAADQWFLLAIAKPHHQCAGELLLVPIPRCKPDRALFRCDATSIGSLGPSGACRYFAGYALATRGRTLLQNSSMVFISRSWGTRPLYIHAKIHRTGSRFIKDSICRVTVSTVPTNARPSFHRSARSLVSGSSIPAEKPKGSNHSCPQK